MPYSMQACVLECVLVCIYKEGEEIQPLRMKAEKVKSVQNISIKAQVGNMDPNILQEIFHLKKIFFLLKSRSHNPHPPLPLDCFYKVCLRNNFKVFQRILILVTS